MRILPIILCLAVTHGSPDAQLLHPGDFEYLGAFRLPDEGEYGWNWSGFAATYYPGGDPGGPADGFPGSIFALGHDQLQLVSEISIPAPVISPDKNVADLHTATTLQPFSDITGEMFGYLEIPQAGLAYLPAQAGQSTGKLHFCWSQHFQGLSPTHGWCELDLAHPTPAGPWQLNGFTPYATADYLFDIPADWAAANTPGLLLATGRFREGFWAGMGPALFALGPWHEGNPPAPGATLTQVTPLLLYGVQEQGIPEIVTDDSMKMSTFNPDDSWSGAAWLAAGTKSAVAFVGTKAMGSWWYGFLDGTVWPDEPPYPPEPPWPYDDRGYWSDSVKAQILLFDPAELAAVARGELPTWAPQPYDSLDIDAVLFDPVRDPYRDKYSLLGACCFDRERSILYVFEHRADGEQCLVHAWRIHPLDCIDFPLGEARILRVWPVPSGGAVTISCGSDGAWPAGDLAIYDVEGKLIRSLMLQPGRWGREARWDGRDEAGVPVAAGVYLCSVRGRGDQILAQAAPVVVRQ